MWFFSSWFYLPNGINEYERFFSLSIPFTTMAMYLLAINLSVDLSKFSNLNHFLLWWTMRLFITFAAYLFRFHYSIRFFGHWKSRKINFKSDKFWFEWTLCINWFYLLILNRNLFSLGQHNYTNESHQNTIQTLIFDCIQTERCKLDLAATQKIASTMSEWKKNAFTNWTYDLSHCKSHFCDQ